MSRKLQLFLVVALIAALTLAGLYHLNVTAQNASAISIRVRAGFDGYCKYNAWIPLQATLENQGEDVEGQLEALLTGLNGERVVYAQPLSLANNSRKETFIYVYLESFQSEFTIQFLVNGRPPVETKVNMNCISTPDLLYGVIAASPSSFQVLSELDPPGGRANIAQLELADLPDRPPALQALDVLVISGVDTGALTPSQQSALANWVASGKRLVITGGPAWQQTAAGLDELLPLSPDTSATLPGLPTLGDYSGREADLAGDTVVASGRLASDSQILVSGSGIPLVVEKKLGSGAIYYLAFDPALEPVKSWNDVVEFYRKLLADPINKLGWASGIHNWSAARQAVTSLPNLSLPRTSLVFAFLLLYILAVGPVNYILLRLLKRRELAWVSIPALVVLFSAGAIFIGSLASGNRPILNRLAIVQVWPGESQAQVDGLIAIYSPRRATYQLDIPPNYLVHPIPEDNSLLNRGGWTVSDQGLGGTSLPDLRVDVSGIRSVAVQGQALAPLFTENLALEMDSSGVKITGSLDNQSELKLNGATLLGLGGAQPLGDIQADSTTQIQLAFKPSSRAILNSANPTYPFSSPVYYSGSVGAPYPGPSGTVYYSQGGLSNPALVALVGTQDIYSQTDAYRKYFLLNATTSFDPPANTQGGGFYLAGWSEDPLLDARLADRKFISSDENLYLVALHPVWTLSAASQTLPPGLFTCSSLETNDNPGISKSAGVAPYDLYLDQENYGFRFTPALPVRFQSIESLILHLTSYGANGPAGLEVSLWDFKANQWASISNPRWGDQEIPEPNRYVSDQGEIRMILDNKDSPQPKQIQAADFSLVVRGGQ